MFSWFLPLPHPVTEEAVEIATLMSDEDTLILATGSLAYLGRVINVIGRTYNR